MVANSKQENVSIIAVSDKQEIHIDTYRDVDTDKLLEVDIRSWFKSSKECKMVPSPKGVRIAVEGMQQLYDTLALLKEEF